MSDRILVEFSITVRDNSFIDEEGKRANMAVSRDVVEQLSDDKYRIGLVLVEIIGTAYQEKNNLDSVFEVLFTRYHVACDAQIKNSDELKMIVNLLLKLNTDINATNYCGRSVLGQYIEFLRSFYPQRHPVYDKNHISIVRLLLEKGVDISVVDSDGYSVLHQAIDNDCDTEIIRMLVKAGSSLNSFTECGDNPLSLALGSYNKNTITFLIESGANLNASAPEKYDNDNETSLLVNLLTSMAESGDDDTYLLRLFLQSGADVNYRNREGDSVLHHAVLGELFEEAICMLVRFGAEVNYKNHALQTPLHVAAQDAPSLVRCLIECGADPHATDDKGRIPLDLYKGNDETVVSLLSVKRSAE